MPIERPVDWNAARTTRRQSIGFALLLPGLLDYDSNRRDRGRLFLGTFLASSAIGVFAWGTRTGLVFFLLAYGTHVVSASAVIRQWTFPGFGKWTPGVAASAGLGLGCYGPIFLMGSILAWPGTQADRGKDGYLINRFAYREQDPKIGDDVWIGPSRGRSYSMLARVLAEPGTEIEWTDTTFRADGRVVSFPRPRPAGVARTLTYRVPSDQILVAFRSDDPLEAEGWELVPKSQVEGRAWAKIYPVWERRLLR